MKVGRAFWFVLPAWLVPIIAVSVYLGRAPNVITRQADAGSFVSAQVQPPGVFFGATTSVQTTHGILFVSGTFTAPTGEPLILRESTVEGMQLCRQGSDDACVELEGRYVGEIPAVGAHTWLTYSVRQNLKSACLWWFLFGLAGTAFAAIAGTEPSEGHDDGA
jgi:hypothetical protein